MIKAHDLRFYKDKRNENRWRIRAKNGKITGSSSEGYVNWDMIVYNSKSVAQSILAFFNADSPEWKDDKVHVHQIKFYRSLRSLGKWRWRIKAKNGNIIGGSSQGYWRKGMCIYNSKSVALSIAKEFGATVPAWEQGVA